MTPIAPHISAFLRQHLPGEKGASVQTCESYAYTFQLLFTFARKDFGLNPIHRGADIGMTAIPPQIPGLVQLQDKIVARSALTIYPYSLGIILFVTDNSHQGA